MFNTEGDLPSPESARTSKDAECRRWAFALDLGLSFAERGDAQTDLDPLFQKTTAFTLGPHKGRALSWLP
jgi:hypothetical protein